MRTTIKDIAEHTGLSITTISLVLNGKASKIPLKTKNAIFRAVEELDYRPNQIAVGLVKKSMKTIGLVISDISNVFFANLAKGVEDACRINGWNLILCNTSDIHQRDMEYIRVLADKGVDGIIYAMSVDSRIEKAQESLELMEKMKIPYIMVDRTLKGATCCSISANHEKGGYLAARHLIDLGHTRIACVTGPLYLEDTADRLMGYRRALEEAGIPYDPALIYEGYYTTESGVKAMEALQGQDFTAVFAFNDLSAYGVYNQLKKYHRSIPGDVSLVGYDDIFFSELLDVPLTTINQPVYEMGAEAARQFIDRNKPEERAAKSVVFEPTLVVRESTRRRVQAP